DRGTRSCRPIGSRASTRWAITSHGSRPSTGTISTTTTRSSTTAASSHHRTASRKRPSTASSDCKRSGGRFESDLLNNGIEMSIHPTNASPGVNSAGEIPNEDVPGDPFTGDRAADWFAGDLPLEEFRELGYRAVDAITEYFSSVRDLPVFPNRPSAEIQRDFVEPLPEEGQPPDDILDEWIDRILPNSTHIGSPRYFGFVNGSGSMMGVLADALAASVNMNLGGWKASPAATEIERRTIAWLAEMIGYDPACGGLLTSGGQMANFTALQTALRSKAAYDSTPNGLQDGARTGRFLLYTADHEGHVSIVRAADLMNLGREAVRRVPSRDDFTMDVDALRRMLDEDVDRGDTPFCVVGQVGSINVGAIDPL